MSPLELLLNDIRAHTCCVCGEQAATRVDEPLGDGTYRHSYLCELHDRMRMPEEVIVDGPPGTHVTHHRPGCGCRICTDQKTGIQYPVWTTEV